MGDTDIVNRLREWDKMLEPLWLGRVKRYWLELVHIIASVATIISFLLVMAKIDKPEFWYVVILLIYLAVAFVVIFFQHFCYARKARYSEAIRIFHPIAHILRDAYYNIEQMDQDAFEVTLGKILDAVGAGFERVTGTQVRVCIKRLKVEGGLEALKEQTPLRRSDIIHADLFVNDNHSTSPEKIDADPPDDKNWLTRNSAFCSIFNGRNNYYIENNIPLAYKRHRYESSSFARYGQGRPGKPKWVLPYRSTIIWPIRKLVGKKYGPARREPLLERHDIFGFLCVDSESRYVWASRYDPEMGAAVADMLYTFMDTWFKNREREVHPATTD